MNELDPKKIIKEVCQEVYDEMEDTNKKIIIQGCFGFCNSIIGIIQWLLMLYGAEKITDIVLRIIALFN